MENLHRFYEVAIEYGDPYYFKDYNNARDFLWEYYLSNATEATAEEIEAAKEQLNLEDAISDFGWIYYYDFED